MDKNIHAMCKQHQWILTEYKKFTDMIFNFYIIGISLAV